MTTHLAIIKDTIQNILFLLQNGLLLRIELLDTVMMDYLLSDGLLAL